MPGLYGEEQEAVSMAGISNGQKRWEKQNVKKQKGQAEKQIKTESGRGTGKNTENRKDRAVLPERLKA